MTATPAQMAQNALADPFDMYAAIAVAATPDGATFTTEFSAHIACDDQQLCTLAIAALAEQYSIDFTDPRVAVGADWAEGGEP